jgi:hypothetical protein
MITGKMNKNVEKPRFKQNPKLGISVVKNSIQNRIEKHNKEISLYRNIIQANIHDTTTVKQYVELIRSEKISIRECNMILKNCF